MANEQNLRPAGKGGHCLSKEDQLKGVRASVEARKARKTLKEELTLLLSKGNTQNKMSLALIEKAMSGDTKAFEVIRDTIGEKPKDEVALETDGGIAVNIRVEE